MLRRIVLALLAAGTLMAFVDAASAQASSPGAAPDLANLPRGVDAPVLKAEVQLDRAGFSPGAVDGRGGDNFRKVLAAFQVHNGLTASGRLDAATRDKLDGVSQEPVLAEYTITPADVEGPFVKELPRKMEAMAKLPRLAYTGPRQELAERFHMAQSLLQALNRKVKFDQAGMRIRVANLGSLRPSATTGAVQADSANNGPKVERIEIDKRERVLRAFDKDGHLVAFYPASIGSAEKPAPTGAFKVKGVAHDPTYRYDPKFAFKEVKTQKTFTISPGPNNPVGVVWIDLTAPSYGIHGTPNPEKIGKTESHGCIRLTNWDALALGAMVHKGTQVNFVQ